MQSLLDPAILFFALGVFAGLVRSNLEMPAAISKFLSIYLLMALGLKGGFALAQSGLTPQVAVGLACAGIAAFIGPSRVQAPRRKAARHAATTAGTKTHPATARRRLPSQVSAPLTLRAHSPAFPHEERSS